MNKTRLSLALAWLVSVTTLVACSRDDSGQAAVPPPAETAVTAPAMPVGNPMVGGATMDPDMDVVANASNSAEHKTLVAAVQSAGLVETLQAPGPLTVFAPTDSAFMALPEGTLDGLQQPGSRDALSGLLNYHVVEGAFDTVALKEQIAAGDGQATLNTVSGGTLTVEMGPAGGLQVIDASGNAANLSVADVRQSNGVVHVIDEVLMP